MQLHIENVTVNVTSGPSAISRAFIEALLRAPEVDTGTERELSTQADQAHSTIPAIGEYWPGQGGIYAGLCRGRDGEADYHLILCKEASEQEFKWQDALDHAKTIEADGHKDFMVPTRWESALLYANLQDQFDTDYWHWTSTQDSETYAWGQLFDGGSQYYNYKVYERRCRFVRRLVL
jgi:hypothetical protein